MANPMTGRVIQGRFEILDEIGRGGMGIVFRARQLSLDRIVALKVLSADLVQDAAFRERFRQEARIIARLNHPNIVQVYDVYDLEDDGGFCIVMEYLQGGSLRELLKAAGRLPIPRALLIARQVAAGLGYAHAQGIVHRDIKPDNIMLLADDRVKLMDFGIARLREGTVRTEAGTTMGTPQFMSPEQAAGKAVDARSDLYSLAVALYGMVTGALPFTGDSPVTIALRQIQDVPARPSEVFPGVPPALDALILKGMAKRPEERFQSAEELRAALSEFGASERLPTPADDADATYVSPAAMPAAAATTVSQISEALPASATLPPVTTATTAPMSHVARRRLNWAWIAAAMPGLLALAIVLYVTLWRDHISRADVQREPLTALLARLERAKPERVQALVRQYEGDLFRRLAEEIARADQAGRPRESWPARLRARDLILPNVAPEKLDQWEKLLAGPRPEGRGGGGRGGGGGPREGGAQRLFEDRIEGWLLAPQDIKVRPDKVYAKRAFQQAEKAFEELRRGGGDLRGNVGLVTECLEKYGESVIFDRANALHHLRFAEFLNFLAEQIPPPRRGPVLDLALMHARRAAELGPVKPGEPETLRLLNDELARKRREIPPGPKRGPAPSPRRGWRGGERAGPLGPPESDRPTSPGLRPKRPRDRREP